MIDTKKIGNLTELQCITRFYELNCVVSTPYGDSEKYDFILDVNNKLYKIQCKHGQVHYTDDGQPDYITVRTHWSSGYTRNSPAVRNKYTKEEIDFFVTHYEGKNYLIKVEECSYEKTLRILPPKNNQTKGINFLHMFEDKEILKTL